MKKILLAFIIILLLIGGGIFFAVKLFKKGVTNTLPNVVFQDFGIQLPKEDVEGEDLPDVPRYRPSVRVSYNKDTAGDTVFVNLVYYTKDKIDKVDDFYSQEMPKNDWRLVKEESMPGISFLNFKISNSRILDFRKKNCPNTDECLPAVKITTGSFSFQGNEYTGIIIDYESSNNTSGGDTTTPKVGKDNEPTTKVSSTSPTSEAGKSFDELLRAILSKISGGQVILTSFNEYNIFGQYIIEAEYTLPSPIQDVSQAVSIIREGFINQGVPNSAISSNVTAERGEIQILFQKDLANQKVNVIAVTVQRNSNVIEAQAYSNSQ